MIYAYAMGQHIRCDNSYQKIGWFAYWVIFHAFLLSAILLQNQPFQIVISGLPSEVSNSLDPDQARRRFVGPDQGPNCLQCLSADDASRQRNDKEICDDYEVGQ